ncbi:hypothetical protein DLJ61_05000 [Gordonia terrae]|uniref:DUF5134 domain-containing protein n=2 Tax=Gordonia terrae TaxID=2055 RepID=A0AAD0K5C6_9ACTN|nr:hypothetical protein BCM27_04960 [Gordonia terrae]AWO82985.1 hypothetical protein DLJ61_05000 [Gordonia terrae]GAB46282.1 hypothetical protein GOTRE_150_00240 [Gordonia terrae NBRC 100016]VTR09638.1 Uncharacterised protein [Clostridioides difficile]VTS30478.1 Uncharacterised protein [Gordonia terrae]
MTVCVDRGRGAADTRGAVGRVAGAGALLVALANAGAHVIIVAHMPVVQLLMWGAMAITCVACGWHLMLKPSVRAWATTTVMSAGMLAVHLQGSVGPGDLGHHHIRRGAVAGSAIVDVSASMWASLILTGAEVLLGVIGVWVMTSSRPPAAVQAVCGKATQSLSSTWSTVEHLSSPGGRSFYRRAETTSRGASAG